MEAPMSPVQATRDSMPSTPSSVPDNDIQSTLGEHAAPRSHLPIGNLDLGDRELNSNKEPPTPVAPNAAKRSGTLVRTILF
jgi:hypothetical protein